ncbi:hypothetical protein BO71DRAFT_428211 [Aspergillus ellipticus CBS 707.79]|uniref:Uncharacterized protein n=1 Tax=Aspergillus ellipticus CBS 707.79 TaxID=1448320 RepID=A0A319DFZ7_9EURO|nr:hypothetical protein BO71DRAFT_428211 [Aspergillus ellipticus CBS 707.79]
MPIPSSLNNCQRPSSGPPDIIAIRRSPLMPHDPVQRVFIQTRSASGSGPVLGPVCNLHHPRWPPGGDSHRANYKKVTRRSALGLLGPGALFRGPPDPSGPPGVGQHPYPSIGTHR